MTKPTITLEQQRVITDRLASIPHLAVGMGTEDAPCSIAAINLALTGELTDEIPECMSEIIGRWIIAIQDRAPSELCRDHPRWRELLPLAAGTGRKLEVERVSLILDWMWGVLALPAVVAAVPDDARVAWAMMLEERTATVADAARRAIRDASGYVDHAAITAADAADAARAVTHAADAVAVAYAIDAVDSATDAAGAAGAVSPGLWPGVDLIGLLERLIKVGATDD